jgi:hypothetical protein
MIGDVGIGSYAKGLGLFSGPFPGCVAGPVQPPPAYETCGLAPYPLVESKKVQFVFVS